MSKKNINFEEYLNEFLNVKNLNIETKSQISKPKHKMKIKTKKEKKSHKIMELNIKSAVNDILKMAFTGKLCNYAKNKKLNSIYALLVIVASSNGSNVSLDNVYIPNCFSREIDRSHLFLVGLLNKFFVSKDMYFDEEYVEQIKKCILSNENFKNCPNCSENPCWHFLEMIELNLKKFVGNNEEPDKKDKKSQTLITNYMLNK